MASDESEVLAAAEVVKSGAGDYSLKAIIKRELAATTVVDWAIAHLDAQRKREEERGMPVTESLLRSFGLYDSYPNFPGRVLRTRCGLEIWNPEGFWAMKNNPTINEVRLDTVGHFLDLLVGLGIAKGGGE